MVLRFLLHCKGHSLMFTLSEYFNYFFKNKAAVRKLWKNKTSLMNDNCPYKSNRLGQHRQDILYRKKCVLFLLIVWSNTYGTDTIVATLETKRTRTDCSSVCETYWLLIFLYMYMYKGFNKRMNKKYIQKVFLKNIMRSAHSFLFFYLINNQNRTRFFQCN